MAAINNTTYYIENVVFDLDHSETNDYFVDISVYDLKQFPDTPTIIKDRTATVILDKSAKPEKITASDIILHSKDGNDRERIIFPVTRYDNVFSAPRVVNDISKTCGAPFSLLILNKVELDDDVVASLMEGVF